MVYDVERYVDIDFQALNSQTLEANTIYYAKAFLDDINGNVASSSLITFRTSADLGGVKIDNSYYLPTATTTASSTPENLQISCDSSSGLIEYSTCLMFSWLFTPSDKTLNRWVELKNDLSNKAPFGYFTSLNNSINTITTATSSKAFLLADLSGLNNNFFNKINSILSFILWSVYGFSLFNRFKHFNL